MFFAFTLLQNSTTPLLQGPPQNREGSKKLWWQNDVSVLESVPWKGVVTMKVVKIKGRNRIDVKKRVLDYYFCNRDQLGESLKEFFKRCIIDPNGKTVIIRG